jgi:hypothetical protein
MSMYGNASSPTRTVTQPFGDFASFQTAPQSLSTPKSFDVFSSITPQNPIGAMNPSGPGSNVFDAFSAIPQNSKQPVSQQSARILDAFESLSVQASVPVDFFSSSSAQNALTAPVSTNIAAVTSIQPSNDFGDFLNYPSAKNPQSEPSVFESFNVSPQQHTSAQQTSTSLGFVNPLPVPVQGVSPVSKGMASLPAFEDGWGSFQ